MTDLLKRLKRLEQDVRYQQPPSTQDPEFHYIAGERLPVLVSAPHGAAHTRAGMQKPEDEYTAAMALLLGELIGVHVLYARRKSATDPNADPHAPYKGLLRQIAGEQGIRFVLDLHGALHSRKFGLALGTMNGRSCQGQIKTILATLEAYGFFYPPRPGMDVLQTVSLDGTYAANGEDGRIPITRFAWEELGMPAAQVEINGNLRIVQRKADASDKTPFASPYPERIENTIRALAAVVEAIAITCSPRAP